MVRGFAMSSLAAERALDLDHLVGLQDVLLAQVLVVLQRDAAIEARADFLRVVLLAAQREDLAGMDDLAVAEDADLAVAEHRTVGDVATRDRADLRALEQRAHFD